MKVAFAGTVIKVVIEFVVCQRDISDVSHTAAYLSPHSGMCSYMVYE